MRSLIWTKLKSESAKVSKFMNGKTIAVISVTVIGAVGATFLLAPDAFSRYEEPAYSTGQKEGNIEIRKYPELIAAQITVDGTGKSAANDAFKTLAGYIFGKNKPKEKIAMTVPVTQRSASEKIAMTIPVVERIDSAKMTMQFYMPSKYDLTTLPEAIDTRIKFLKVPEATYAVIKFAGNGSEQNMKSHEDELQVFLQNKKLVSSGDSFRAFYNPPWTPPFMRRNEIWIPLAQQSELNGSIL